MLALISGDVNHRSGDYQEYARALQKKARFNASACSRPRRQLPPSRRFNYQFNYHRFFFSRICEYRKEFLRSTHAHTLYTHTCFSSKSLIIQYLKKLVTRDIKVAYNKFVICYARNKYIYIYRLIVTEESDIATNEISRDRNERTFPLIAPTIFRRSLSATLYGNYIIVRARASLPAGLVNHVRIKRFGRASE